MAITEPAPESAAEHPAITRSLVWTMAVASGFSVANLYYNQPLLADIGRGFHATVRQLGAIPLLTQVGYAVGMLLFVPLGDMLERRRVIVAMLCAVSVALAGAAITRSVTALAVMGLLIGITTIVPQLIVPFAAQLAQPAERGRVVGGVMSGLLIGILVARTLSGEVGAHFGWRTMYGVAAATMALLAVVCRFAFPESHPRETLSYRAVMASLLELARTQPVLREASLVGAMLFGAFSAFWTTLVFLLGSSAYQYAHATEAAGLFGLVGVVGASAAAMAGRLADKNGPRPVVKLGIVISIVAFAVFWVAGLRLWGLIAGVILLDFGTQAAQVSNQAAIYSLGLNAPNRLNTVYMVTYFLGGSLGSYLGALGWSRWHWHGVCAVGLILPLVALASLALWPRRT